MKTQSAQHISDKNVRRKFLSALEYLLYLFVIFLIADFLIGFLIKNNSFMGYPVPPYGAVITENQTNELQQLDEPDSSEYLIFSKELGWTIGLNRTRNDNMYRSNSAGIRANREYTVHVPAGVTRVAAFGNSFTEGVGVRNDQCWTYLLQKDLKNVEVLNFGVRAYGTDQAFMRYRIEGKRYQPNIVIIGFMLENIRRNVNRYRLIYEHNTGSPVPHDYWYDKFKYAFAKDSRLFRLNTARIGWLFYEKYQRNQEKMYFDEASEPFVITCEILKSFTNEAIQNGAQKAMVVLFPGKNQLEYFQQNGKKYWRSLIKFLQANNIEYLDITDGMIAAYDHDRGAVIKGHYTPYGNEIVSSLILDWLKQHEMNRT
jgi:hypothetical protein